MANSWSAVDASIAEQYRTDGVVCLRGALDARELRTLQDAFDYSRTHPGPQARSFYPETGATFYQDISNVANWPYYRAFLKHLSLPDICRALWGAEDVWFMNEQIFLKEGGKARRTPWHQDASYTPYGGQHLAIMWINFDPVAKLDSLEFIRGSHRGPVYNGSAFDPSDDSLPAFVGSSLPRLPSIEAQRDKWDIISFQVEPGDIVIFHNQVLHGRAPTRPGLRRRTLSLRFFGKDVVRVERDRSARTSSPGQIDDGLLSDSALISNLAPGQPLHMLPNFFRLRPISQAP